MNKQCVSVSRLPPKFQSLFNFYQFNRVQSECFEVAFESDSNLVISAPTGCGKTVIAELAILHALNVNSDEINHADSPTLIIYVAPLRALCQEKASLWAAKYEKIGVTVTELTSDTQTSFPKNIKNTTIICTTPEKLDLATRQSSNLNNTNLNGVNHRNGNLSGVFQQLSLVIFDEIHNLSENRGSVLEAVISRILFISDLNRECHNLKQIRIIGLSATIRNYDDFCQWLRVKHKTQFDDSYRETRIETRVFGYKLSISKNSFRPNDWMFESSLTSKVTPIIRQLSNGKPVIIFCCTRKSCEKTALKIAEDFRLNSLSSDIVNPNVVKDKTLLLSLKGGVGIHTAGLCQSDRSLVENLFLKNDIRFICTTSTLSQGINLPAYMVIIKGTKHFNNGSLEEYEATQIFQMQGRAGRPQFEKEGICVIMTEKDNVKRYENLIYQSNLIESSLMYNLPEHLNAEIALGFISDENDVLRWLTSTFLFIRIQKNPYNYHLTDVRNAASYLKGLCMKNLKELAKCQFISLNTSKDQNYGKISSLPIGTICSQFCTMIETMTIYNENSPPKTIKDALILLSKSCEFVSDIIVRQEEKQKLRLMNVQPSLRFGEIDDKKDNFFSPETKVYLLIETMLSTGKIDDWGLSQEYLRIKRTAERLLSCLIQLNIYKKSLSGSVNSVILLKCLKKQMWENNTERLAQQIKGIGEVYAKKISSSEEIVCKSFTQLRKLNIYQIDKLTGHRPGWGISILEEIHKVPEYSISFHIVSHSNRLTTQKILNSTIHPNGDIIDGINNENANYDDVEFSLNIMNLSQKDSDISFHKVEIFIGVKESDHLIDHFTIKKVSGHLNETISFFVPKTIGLSDISVFVIDTEFIGIDIEKKINLNEITLIDASQLQLKQNPIDKEKKSRNSVITQFYPIEKPITNPTKPQNLSQQRILALCPEVFIFNKNNKIENGYQNKEIDSMEEIVWTRKNNLSSNSHIPTKSNKSDVNMGKNELKNVFSTTESSNSIYFQTKLKTTNKTKRSSIKNDRTDELFLKVQNNNNQFNKIESNQNIEKSNFRGLENSSKMKDSSEFKLDDDFWEHIEFDE
ncbi:DEAD/DEAH box helicase family protein [Tritrichomonas foetus]|uniref:DNA 3'-5' helicase n=1 Tax=Tritrichomonas foetus TaxID=1144522 RepID=A0A1J4K0A9_9EUKA|nr:DEAD/DEAH box helicase family protein [Tritrichomonas foetus]|eukprot:OHT04857.1 DEAD/DEAH box helicase family protein [Tritrichomonas foetus]